jgi:hypothetical protein
MKKYKYVRLGMNGESAEVDGEILHTSARRTDLNRLLAEGWCPLRETLVTYVHWRFFRKYSYPYFLILLEKDFDQESAK